MEEQYRRDVLSSQRFPCPTCDRIVTGLVRGKGQLPQSCRTHCCRNCAAGREHDDFWCGGTPSRLVRRLHLKSSPYAEDKSRVAHYVLHEPDWQKVKAPVPAVLFLHGAFTYLWPETLWRELKVLLDGNQNARDCVVIAPYATIGEPLAVISQRQYKEDRFRCKRPYVDSFNAELTWECFVGACLDLGSDRVDFQRLCVIGYSMGAQATWEIAARHGAHIAAAAPIAGRAHWSTLNDISDEQKLEALRAVRLRQYAVESDYTAFSWRELQWVASEGRQLSSRPSEPVVQQVPRTVDEAAKEAVSYNWGPDLQLTLFRGAQNGKIALNGADQHNCWDTVFTRESLFGLFRWFASSVNPGGAALAMGTQDPNAAETKELEADIVQESLLAQACRRRDLFQVQALLRDKADPNERSAAGETPLLEAATGGDVNVVALLLAHGADVATRARPGFEADAERGLHRHIRVLFRIFREKSSTEDRRAALDSMPVALDPGALAQARVKLGLGGRQAGGVRLGGMAPAEALRRRTPLREAEAAANHDIVLHVADPLRPVLAANPLWQKPTATVVLLHGLLQSGQMLERMIRDLARNLLHVRFLAPTAPTIPSPWGVGPAWVNLVDRVPEGMPLRYTRQSMSELMEMLELEEEDGILPGRMVLAGFSMGAWMASSLALQAQQKFAGLLIMGSAPHCTKVSPQAAEGLPVLQVHGEDDNMTTLADALTSADVLRGAGCNVHFSSHGNVGHTVSAKMLEEIRSWLLECLPAGGTRNKAEHTAEPEVHTESVETDMESAADQGAEVAEVEAEVVPEQFEAPEIGEFGGVEPLPKDRSTDADWGTQHSTGSSVDEPDKDWTTVRVTCEADLFNNASATGLEQVDEELDGFSASCKSERRREDALALLLAFDLPLRACEEVLPRFDYDGDAALEFLLDSSEGQQLVSKTVAEAETLDTSVLPDGVQGFQISTPPEAENTDAMESYDDELDWGTLEYRTDMSKSRRQTSTSSSSSVDFWEDVLPEGAGGSPERQEQISEPTSDVTLDAAEAECAEVASEIEVAEAEAPEAEAAEAEAPEAEAAEAEAFEAAEAEAPEAEAGEAEAAELEAAEAAAPQVEASEAEAPEADAGEAEAAEVEAAEAAAPQAEAAEAEVPEADAAALQDLLPHTTRTEDAPVGEAARSVAPVVEVETGSSRPSADDHELALLLAYDLPSEACRRALRRFGNDADAALDFLMDTKEGQDICAEAEAVATLRADLAVDARAASAAGSDTEGAAGRATEASRFAASGHNPKAGLGVDLTADASDQTSVRATGGGASEAARDIGVGAAEAITTSTIFGPGRASSDRAVEAATIAPADKLDRASIARAAEVVRITTADIPDRASNDGTAEGATTVPRDGPDRSSNGRAAQGATTATNDGLDRASSDRATEIAASMSRAGPANSYRAGEAATVWTSDDRASSDAAAEDAISTITDGPVRASSDRAVEAATIASADKLDTASIDRAAEDVTITAADVLDRASNDGTAEGATTMTNDGPARSSNGRATEGATTATSARLDRASSDRATEVAASMSSAGTARSYGAGDAARMSTSDDRASSDAAAEVATRTTDGHDRVSSDGAVEVGTTTRGDKAAEATMGDTPDRSSTDGAAEDVTATARAREAKAAGPVLGQASPDEPLAAAAKQGNLVKVKQLLRKGEDANLRGSKGETPLLAGVRGGYIDVVAVLLLGKADPRSWSSSEVCSLLELAPRSEMRWLLELACGRTVGVQEQRSTFAALDDCTPFLIHELLKARGMQVAVSNVMSERQWNLACASSPHPVPAAVAA